MVIRNTLTVNMNARCIPRREQGIHLFSPAFVDVFYVSVYYTGTLIVSGAVALVPRWDYGVP